MLGRVRKAAVAVQARAAGLTGGARSFPRLRLPQTGWRGRLADAAAAARSAAGYHVAHLSTAATPPPPPPPPASPVGAAAVATAPTAAVAAAAAAVKPASALAPASAGTPPTTPTPGGIPSLRAIHPKTASAPPEVGNSHSLWINNVYRFGLLINYWRIIGKPFEKLFNLHPGQRMEQQVHAELREVFGKHGVGLSVSHIVSQFKEKGVYVTFAHPKYAELAYKKRELLKFRGKPLNAYIVKGVPFIEDIVSTKASPKLKVTLYPVPPSNDKDKDTPTFFHAQNQFFGLLRPYGLCYDLHTEGKNVYVTFVTKQAATTARNCLHGWRVSIQPPATQKPTIATGAAPGAPVPPTPTAPTANAPGAPAVTDAVQGVINGSLVVSFEPYSRFKPIREAFMNPRLLPILVLLVIVALLMAISPLRLVNVTQNLATAWSEKEKPRNTVQERDELEQLRALFTQLPTSVTVITGPKGSGKSDLIKKILHKRRFVARIDCSAKDLVGGTASKEMAFIENFQHAIGFWPSFSTINTLISYVETLLPTKSSALTANQSLQLTSVLGTLEQALRIVSINFPRNQNASYEYPIVVFDGFHTLIQGLESRANNEKERETAQMILDSLIKWSIECTQVNQTAHIVFVADNAFTTDILSRNERLRGRLNEIFVGDLPRDSAFAYIAENVAAHAKNVTEVPADDNAEHHAAAEKEKAKTAAPAANRGLGLDFGVFSILRNLAKLPGSAPRDANSSGGASGAAPGAAAASNARVAAVPDGTIVTNAGGGAGGDDEEAVLKLQISQRLSAAIDKAIDVIGGRMSDMDSLVNRTRTGKSINDALREMNAEARRDILHRGFGSKLFVDSSLPGRSWNQIHLWKCVKLLSQHVPLPPPHPDPALAGASAGAAAAAAAALAADAAKRAAAGEGGNGDAAAPSPALLYRNVLYSVFDGDEEALRSLVSENILTLQQPPRTVGAPAPAPAPTAASGSSGAASGAAPAERLPEDRWVNAGSPLLLHAMRSLTRDAKFAVLMDNMVLKADIKKLKAEVDEVEAELVRLAEAQFSGAGEVRSRLYAKLADKTKLIKAAEAQIKRI